MADAFAISVSSPTLVTAMHSSVDSLIQSYKPTAAPLSPSNNPGIKHNDFQRRIEQGPEYLTITIWNNYGNAITTSHASNANGPTISGGIITQGTIPSNASGAFAVPTGYAGNVAVNDANYKVTGDNSLIELSYVIPQGYNFAIADIDISYVNGFSVPITCQCSGIHITGCNTNLFDTNILCGDNNGENACVNPMRNSSDSSPAPFFAPCAGAAYTFPNDNRANSWGACQNGTVECCVGDKCPASILQHS